MPKYPGQVGVTRLQTRRYLVPELFAVRSVGWKPLNETGCGPALAWGVVEDQLVRFNFTTRSSRSRPLHSAGEHKATGVKNAARL